MIAVVTAAPYRYLCPRPLDRVFSIARPDMLAGYAPRRLYARLSGIQALLVIAAEASAPTAGATVRAASGADFRTVTVPRAAPETAAPSRLARRACLTCYARKPKLPP